MKPKRHNSSKGVKTKIRRTLISALGGPSQVDVLDLFCGQGVMRRAVYKEVHDWLGIDQDKDCFDAIHADNRHIMRAIDLASFNLFDIDAYGSPYEQMWLISQRRKPKKKDRIALAITCGSTGGYATLCPVVQSRSVQMELAGINIEAQNKYVSHKNSDIFIHHLVGSWFDAWNIEKFFSAKSKNGHVRYYGAVLGNSLGMESKP